MSIAQLKLSETAMRLATKVCACVSPELSSPQQLTSPSIPMAQLWSELSMATNCPEGVDNAPADLPAGHEALCRQPTAKIRDQLKPLENHQQAQWFVHRKPSPQH